MPEQIMQELSGLEKLYDTAIEYIVTYSFQVLGAILILILGIFVSRYISNATVSLCERKNIDITLRTYLGHIVRLLILFCFIVIALGKFGITIAPFVAALGAVTLGIGLALQGLVSNYGAGISIIITRPFKVGDSITVNGVSGEVTQINLAATILETEDQEHIMVPNKHIVGEVLTNTFAFKLVETVIGIDYSNSPEQAITTIKTTLAKLDYVCQQPEPQVGIDSFGDSSINIGVRFLVPTKRFYECRYNANLAIFNTVKSAGLTIPYPIMDISVKQA